MSSDLKAAVRPAGQTQPQPARAPKQLPKQGRPMVTLKKGLGPDRLVKK